jgi:hypothetical protein
MRHSGCTVHVIAAVWLGFSGIQSATLAAGQTNEWTKATSGYWEEPFWSLGQLPAMDQALVAFMNPGFKALAIGENTTMNFSNALAIRNLVVEGPTNSLNQLLLNYAGLTVPLSVSSDFNLGTNASLVSYYSALRGGNLYLSSPASFSVGSTVDFGMIEVGANAPAELTLSNATLSANLLILNHSQDGAGTVDQVGGSSQVSNLQLFSGSAYRLESGSFVVSNLDLQSLDGDGTAQFTMSGGAMEVQGPLRLGRPSFIPPSTSLNAHGEFLLQDGDFRCSEMDFLNGRFTQTGGTNLTVKMAVPLLDYSRGEYFLIGGTLVSSNVALGAVLSPFTPSGSANFVQSGGIHTNSNMTLFGDVRQQAVTPFGSYWLSGGLLVSGSVHLLSGAFSQTGGTNYIQELTLDEAGSFVLSSGSLVTSNTTLNTCCCVMSKFIQNAGSHTVQNRLQMQDFVIYELRDGTLTASNFDLGPGGTLRVTGGALSNSGLFTIRGGKLVAGGGQTHQLGQLEVVGVQASICSSIQPVVSSLDMGLGGGTSPSVLRFRDSRDIAWSGPFLILNWSPSTNGFGLDHIFVGTDAQGLTPAQLSLVAFVDPTGWPRGNYAARILGTGEIIPLMPPPLGAMTVANKLILFWEGDYALLSATNVTGPYKPVTGASSPITNIFFDPQRYFRLGPTAP